MKGFVLVFVAAFVAASAIPDGLFRTPQTFEDACQATGVVVAYSDESIFVSWTMPSACSEATRTFLVHYTQDGVTQEVKPLAPGVPMAQVHLGPLTCQKISVAIETFGADGDLIATSEEKHLNIVLASVGDIELVQNDAGVQLSWAALELDGCDVTYEVVIGDADINTDILEPSYLIVNDKVPMCEEVIVTVQAMSNGFRSAADEVTVNKRMPAVELTAKNGENGVEIDFIPLDDTQFSTVCSPVTYRIVETEETCFRSRYSVMAVSQETSPGLEATKVIPKRPTAVNNLNADIRGAEIQLTWTAPTGGETCSLEYTGQYGANNLGIVHSTSMMVAHTTGSCTLDVIEIWATSGNIKGDVSTVEVAGALGEVVGLVCSAGAPEGGKVPVTCQWEKPTECAGARSELNYRVTYYDGQNVRTETTPETVHDFTTISSSCSVSWVVITPLLSDTATGDITEVAVTGCPARDGML